MESGQTNVISEPQNPATEGSAAEPGVVPLPSENSIARDLKQQCEQPDSQSVTEEPNPPEPLRKRDWL
jgi:hypothetical protein